MLASNDVVTLAFHDLKDRGEFSVVLGSPLYLAYPD
jgi:hypothetical protein